MNRLALLAVLACIACRPLFQSRPNQHSQDVDALYWLAVSQSDPANANGSLDSTVALLDKYLASGNPPHAAEARTLRQLARDSQELGRVQAALQMARDAAVENRQRAEAAENKAENRAARKDDAVKEVERLRDELAKARDELERIKKRLAAPPGKP